MIQPSAQSVLIIGAGPAGLAAAFKLAQIGLRVTILEQVMASGEGLAEPTLPPVILGCHLATWDLIQSAGLLEGRSHWQETVLEFRLSSGRLVHYPRSRFPTPLHVVFTLGRFAGLSWKDRWRLLSWLEAIWEGSVSLPTDLENRTAGDWLSSIGQEYSLQRSIWNPLARWLTGNDLNTLSADALIAAIKPFLLQRASDTRILTSEHSGEAAFVSHLRDRLVREGVTVLSSHGAVQFLFEADRMTGVRLKDGSVMKADWYVSALLHDQLASLLPERWLSRYAYFQQMTELTALSCSIVHVCVRGPVRAPRLILLTDEPYHWVQTSRSLGNNGQFSLVTTHSGDKTNDSSHAAAVLESLGLLRNSDQITDITTSGISHASLSLSPGTKARRPIQRSPIANLLLAGAWTDTGWPSNLESAIVSGQRCAQIIAGRDGTPH